MPPPPDLTHLLPTGEIVWRLGVATLVGAIIGLNRELRGKPAGLRTQALVSLGCATATVVISELAALSHDYDVSAISRVFQGILTGVGFLGGGVILRGPHEERVQGLTTAASIWVAATLGLASGAGMWRLALAVTALTLAILHLGFHIENRLKRHHPIGQGEPPFDP